MQSATHCEITLLLYPSVYSFKSVNCWIVWSDSEHRILRRPTYMFLVQFWL